MKKFVFHGESLRSHAKSIVIDFMAIHPDSRSGGEGLKQAQIFRGCGLDWGPQKKATSSNQQYWLVALLRSLESDGLVEQVSESGPWRLKE